MTDVVVVGGGMAGLSAAITLAAAGAKVRLFEKNGRIGGKLNTWRSDGFVFDTGPHVLTMLFAFEQLFTLAGTRLRDHLEMVRLDPICKYHFPDGTAWSVPANPLRADEDIASFAPRDLPGFRRFREHARRVYESTTDTFLTQDVAAAMRRGGPAYAYRQMKQFLALHPLESLDQCVARHIEDPKLQQIFRLYALYSGSHPSRCSSIFSTVAHVQWEQGTYYIKGGLYRLAEVLAKLAQQLGVEMTLNADVRKIVVQFGQARGIEVSYGGNTVLVGADGVVCNEDCMLANRMLFEVDASRPYSKTMLSKINPSTSAFIMLLGVEGEYQQLAHHNSFLTGSEAGEYDSLFDTGTLCDDPTIGVACQSVSDPSRAPEGMSNLFVMANVPAAAKTLQWDSAMVRRYRKKILGKLEAMGMEGLESRIRVEQIWTPHDLLQKYNAWKGTLYGPSSNGWKQAFNRPAQHSRRVRGLYFVGGSTHPGGGLPLCALSGQIAARQYLRRGL